MGDEETVTRQEAIERSLDAFAAEKGAFYESALRPMLGDIAIRLLGDLDAFGFEVVRKSKVDPVTNKRAG